MKRVLITGTNGRIGGMLMRELRNTGRYDVIATARHADPERGILAMNLLDKERILELTKGVDAVIHMAAYLGPGEFEEKVIPNNILGVYYIYEAMRINKVKRMVYGSTNHVIGFYKTTDVIEENTPYRPDTFYGLSKATSELMGRMYSDKYGISCINIRIGHYPADDEPKSPRRTTVWISHRDMAHLVECCLEAPDDIRFLNLYGISKNTGRVWPIDHLKELIGYDPQDDGAVFLERANDPEWSKSFRDAKGNFVDDTGHMGGEFINRE
ncbi:MAG: NAD(P)-dependent oxidoreductase [Oscillospiraceae bacterium]|jgi:uronate dehydrogenase|nr:NAD(P)-dependent oxidoreductase [Oscillospiraceae bacterium]